MVVATKRLPWNRSRNSSRPPVWLLGPTGEVIPREVSRGNAATEGCITEGCIEFRGKGEERK